LHVEVTFSQRRGWDCEIKRFEARRYFIDSMVDKRIRAQSRQRRTTQLPRPSTTPNIARQQQAPTRGRVRARYSSERSSEEAAHRPKLTVHRSLNVESKKHYPHSETIKRAMITCPWDVSIIADQNEASDLSFAVHNISVDHFTSNGAPLVASHGIYPRKSPRG
jgi:hypothetical protein